MGDMVTKPGEIITTPIGSALETPRNSTNRVKFEVRGYNPNEKPYKKPSILARFFKGLGPLAPVGVALAPFTAGFSLIGAGVASSFGYMGSEAVKNSDALQAQAQRGTAPTVMSYPGLGPGGGMAQGGFSGGVSGDPVLDLVTSSRDASLYSSPNDMRK